MADVDKKQGSPIKIIIIVVVVAAVILGAIAYLLWSKISSLELKLSVLDNNTGVDRASIEKLKSDVSKRDDNIIAAASKLGDIEKNIVELKLEYKNMKKAMKVAKVAPTPLSSECKDGSCEFRPDRSEIIREI
jgi:hypothetical protein